jgi:hypothetical protein
MKEKEYVMKKQWTIILKWGLILGVALSIIQMARKFADGFDFYSFGPILDLINVLIFIVIIFAGTKEIKETIYDNVISFSKAFIKGVAIVFTAFIVVFIYLNFHYGVFFKDQMGFVNNKRLERMEERIKQDTIQKFELDSMLDIQKRVVKNQEIVVYKEANIDSLNAIIISGRVDSILSYYFYFMKNQKLNNDNFKLGNFDSYSRSALNDISRKYCSSLPKSDSTITYLSTIILNGTAHFSEHSVVQIRFEKDKSKIKLYTHSFSMAAYFSSQVLIFGILFSIFVAMYLYRRKPSNNQ